MSYVVLARKYRPKRFEELVGQEHVVQALGNGLASQRLHHAYLFTGTRGVGKTTVSRLLAKSLNCTGPDGQGGITASPCGACDACRDIDAGRHVDYVELDAASNRGVEEISQLLDQAVYKPVVGRFKVYMIDEVHMLSNTAFNAMLKTLEEPPEYLKFVLATTDPQKVPPTVLSRCLQFNLRPMAPETVQQHLGQVLAAEAVPAEPGALRLLARAARGSMRDALSLTDQAIAYGAGQLDEAGVRQMLGAVDRGHAVRVVQALQAGDGAGLVAAVDGLRALGLSAAGLLEDLATMLQQMAVLQAVPQAADEADPDTPALRELAAGFAADELQLHYSIALHGRGELALAPDEYGGLVMALLRMLAFRPSAGGADRELARSPATAASPGPVPAKAAALLAPAAPRTSAPVAAPQRPSMAAPQRPPVKKAAERPVSHQASDSAGHHEIAHAPAREPARASDAQELPPPWLDVPHELDVEPESPRRGSAPDSGDSGARADRSPAAPAAGHDRATASGHEAVATDHEASPAAAPAASPAPNQEPAPPAGLKDVARPTAPATAPAPALPVMPATPLGDRWSAVMASLIERGSVIALARELAWQAELLALDEGAADTLVRLRVERESLRAGSHRDKLQAALAALFGTAVRLELEPGIAVDSPALRDAARRAALQREAEDIIRNDPLVLSLMQQFKTARIVPGSIKPISP